MIADLDHEARRPAPGAWQALWVETEIASGTEAGAYHWRLAVARNLGARRPACFINRRTPHGPFRSIRPEAGA